VVGAVTGSDHLRSSSSGAGPQYFPAAGVRTCSGWQSDRAYASTWTTLSTNPLGADHGVECDQANTEKSVRIRVAAVSRRDRAAARGSAGASSSGYHVVPSGHERVGDVRPDETCSSGDQVPRGIAPIFPPPRSSPCKQLSRFEINMVLASGPASQARPRAAAARDHGRRAGASLSPPGRLSPARPIRRARGPGRPAARECARRRRAGRCAGTRW
jgi:hypothetical protein